MAEVYEKRGDLTKPSPMMEQYLLIKEQYSDYILLYRLGDFYEMFFEDAMVAHKAASLTLTARDCGGGKRAAMCGIPFHSADDYIRALVEAGHKVAICEQTEDPSQAKGIVRREVVRVITPGTVTDEHLLKQGQNNFLSAVYYGTESVGLGFADISTGQMYLTELVGEDRESRICNELAIYTPSEVVINVPAGATGSVGQFIVGHLGSMIEEKQTSLFEGKEAQSLTEDCFGESAGALNTTALRLTAAALLRYVRMTQMCEPHFMRELTVYTAGQYMDLDVSTRRNLELTESMRAGEKRGTLLWVLDKTRTSLGARMLRSWITRPLVSVAAIHRRQGAVKELSENFLLRSELRSLLDGILDLERLTAKVMYGTANAKDLRAICRSIQPLPQIRALTLEAKNPTMRELAGELDTLEDLCELLDTALFDDVPFSIREGGMIRDGYHSEVDYLRSVKNDSQAVLAEIEAREREQTGIKTLRVNFNKVFGYYIEITRSLSDQAPEHYIRKQTLTNCERFITPELKELESTVLGAADRLCALEYELFCQIREAVAGVSGRIQSAAATVAALDVYASLAEVAVDNRYVCPEVDASDETVIRDGRHPVVEKFVSDSYFVPNDTHLDTGDNRMMLITGPNMAGKSTYMRQVALITVMAQIGSFVPAAEARIGVADRIFTRVGASDDLASGQSTFMLEMNEVANILKNATRHSLIVYDEVGRGTSTYDGMSIARAVVEYTASRKLGARAMFATHYHELTALEGCCEGVVNFHIAAKKHADSITFLRKIVPGGTDDSYGIEVAKLAGVPAEVIRRAREVLESIEAGKPVAPRTQKVVKEAPEMDMMAQFKMSQAEEVADKLRRLNLETLTPIEAMNVIWGLKKDLE